MKVNKNVDAYLNKFYFHWQILDLRKQARQLENEVDLKLVAFSKLGAGIKTPQNSHADTVPLLSGEDTFEAMSDEIELLLNRVRQPGNQNIHIK